MATLTSVVVDTDGVSGDYSSLSAAISAEAKNLVTADEALTIICQASTGVSDTANVTVNGFTTDATRTLTIKQADAERHNGVYNSSNYELATTSGECLIIQDDYTIIDGLQIDQQDTSSGTHDIIRVDNSQGVVLKNICALTNSGGTGNAGTSRFYINFNTAFTTRVIEIYNCMLFTRDGITVDQTNTGVTDAIIYNNGIASSEFSGNNRYGIRLQRSLGTLNAWVKNNYMINYGAFGTGGADYSVSGVVSVTTATNTTQDNTSPDGASFRGTNPTWEDIFGLDFRLDPTDTGATDKGTDLSTDPSGKLSFTEDGAGFDRFGTWDIGPFENQVVIYEPAAITTTAAVQAPTVATSFSNTVSASVVEATASVQAPTFEIDDTSNQLVKPDAISATASLVSPVIFAGVQPVDVDIDLSAIYGYEKTFSSIFGLNITLSAGVDMPATEQNFTLVAGDSAKLKFPTVDANGDAFALAGSTIKWQLAKDSRGPALITKETALGITLDGASTFDVELSPADTIGLLGEHYHEAEITDVAGNVVTVAKGIAVFERGLIE